ncbi:hypothetical protein FOCC_FOCC014086 [Frankliniella occidentalis]|nr:hypothetical protein FOCC_FOCC014086 [Frankliniella occidentalis]
MMPGSKDYVSVIENGKRVHKQKRLVLCELKELHRLFKEETQIQISFSKFASLRPKHCVLAGAAGTQSVCVCKYHQNFKLLCDSSGFVGFDGSGAETYKDVLASVLCDPPQDDCFLLKCSKCPGLNPLIKKLSDMFEENMIENVTYQQWTTVDRCSLETITQSSDVFIDTFSNQLKVLLPHHFIAKTQSKYLKQLKETLKEGEVVVILDFAQNYLCLIQDAIQSYYWKNDQVTLHPFVAYYIEDGELKKLPLTFVSDYMKHDVQAVYAAQCKLIPFLKARVPNFKIVKYFSDGAASQYKNKFNIYNLSYHETDFGIQAEWHFFATSHGKGVCDGVAGSLKRNAKSASIRKVLIRNPREFYKWAKYRQDLHDGTKVAFVSVQDVEESRIVLEKRLEKALSITNIRSSHTFIPTSQSEIVVKRHSFDETGRFSAVELQRKKAKWTDVQETAFVTIVVGATWKLEVQLEEILTVVQPCEENGKYSLSVNDVNRTVWQLHSKTHFDEQVQSQNEENIIVIPPLFVEWKDIDLETFVIVQVENAWVVGKIIWTEPETEEVIVSCYKRESNREFLATEEDDDAMPFQLRDILLIVHPRCQDEIWKISKDEYTKAEERVRVQTEVQV